MRKLVAISAAASVAVAVAAAPAAAQDDPPVPKFVSKAKVMPKKAGTRKRPRGVRIVGNLRIGETPGFERPILTGGVVFLPKHGRYNGGKYPKCSKRTLKRRGPKGCPKRSIMGAGKGVAWADNVDAEPEVVFVNGGKSTVWAYTTLYNPAFVEEPVRIRVKRIRHRRWGYKVTFNVPRVLQVVAGVPVTLERLRYAIGRKPYARNYIVTTGCPRSKRYPYMAIAKYLFSDGSRKSARFRGSVACR